MHSVDLDEIYKWYKLSGEPNRDKVREGNLILPKGVSKGLIEALLPYFTTRSKETVIIPKLEKEDKKDISMVITSDWHIPFQDNQVLGVFLDFLAEYQPDILVLNGNINDCTSFSSHPRIRDIANVFRNGKEERRQWFSIAELLREVVPDTRIIYIGSQCHEGWIDNWVQSSPILIEDENYTIPGWFKLKDFGIEYIPEVYDPIGDGTLLISHGTVARGKSGASAMASMEMEGTSTIVAHTHRLSQVYKTTAVNEMVGIECGCMCQRKPWYHLKGKRLMMDWQQGFVLVNIKDNSFSAQCIPIIRDGEDNPYFWVGKERYAGRDR